MFVLVFGTDSPGLKQVIMKNFSLDVFHFIPEITSLEKDEVTQEVVLNRRYTLSDYDAIILCDTGVIYNYLWHEANDIPWFHNPFELRAAKNHNFYCSLAQGMKLVVPPAKPSFKDGKVNVVRDFPKGKEASFLLMHNEVVPLTSIDMSRSLQRTCKAFLRNTRVQFGVITFIMERHLGGINEMLLKEFTPIVDWDMLPESHIKSIVEKVLFSAKVVAIGRRSRR